MHDEVVQLKLYLGGIANTIWAYVDDSPTDQRMILGQPAHQAFRITTNHVGTGNGLRMQITVKPDITGYRNCSFVVPRDPAHIRPRAYRAGRNDAIVQQLESPMSIPEYKEYVSGQRRRITEKARSAKKGVQSWLYDQEW